ncbi:expressed unknown protein [Seminavis robusta]|uniref:Fungal lipase-type domain-containing protein n=1 Tax=Seminavis robusta TaxID=568900 RepID=A0A9N8DC63_9STRA|nr:expressed unknown protein [Seminavis robusta]|eukprot:Sro53_g031400.1 n/a (341) ;mRNA; r:73079-74496
MRVFCLCSFVWFLVLLNQKTSTCKGDEETSQCPSIYPDPSDTKLLLSKDFFVKYVNQSVYLADIIKAEDYGPIEDLLPELREMYERADVFSDFDDQALIVKTKDTKMCFASFQATDQANYFAFAVDLWHNINPLTERIEGTDCIIRRGVVQAYNTTYKKEFRRSLDDCIASCGSDEPCPLVLTGASIGGAVAVAAAVDLTSLYDPTVITFSAPKVVVRTAPCEHLNSSKFFRFVNTDSQGNYDLIVNQLNLFNERHLGWTFLLDDVNFPLGSPGINDSRDRCPGSFALHEYNIYRGRVEGIINRDCFPLPIAGWPEGHYCRYDDECQTNYCNKRQCQRGL